MDFLQLLKQPWPWWVSGPLIGLTVPALLLLGNKSFGISGNLRHACAMLLVALEGPGVARGREILREEHAFMFGSSCR